MPPRREATHSPHQKDGTRLTVFSSWELGTPTGGPSHASARLLLTYPGGGMCKKGGRPVVSLSRQTLRKIAGRVKRI